jgi:hypothetical protein
MDEGKKRKDDVTIYITTKIIIHKWILPNLYPYQKLIPKARLE